MVSPPESSSDEESWPVWEVIQISEWEVECQAQTRLESNMESNCVGQLGFLRDIDMQK